MNKKQLYPYQSGTRTLLVESRSYYPDDMRDFKFSDHLKRLEAKGFSRGLFAAEHSGLRRAAATTRDKKLKGIVNTMDNYFVEYIDEVVHSSLEDDSVTFYRRPRNFEISVLDYPAGTDFMFEVHSDLLKFKEREEFELSGLRRKTHLSLRDVDAVVPSLIAYLYGCHFIELPTEMQSDSLFIPEGNYLSPLLANGEGFTTNPLFSEARSRGVLEMRGRSKGGRDSASVACSGGVAQPSLEPTCENANTPLRKYR